MIIKTHNFLGPLACYNSDKREVSYYEDLDDFPTLKEAVIKHEVAHSTQFPNYLKIFWAEIRDYFRLNLRRDYWEFYNAQAKKYPRKWYEYIMQPVYEIITPFIMFVAVIVGFLVNWVRSWQKS